MALQAHRRLATMAGITIAAQLGAPDAALAQGTAPQTAQSGAAQGAADNSFEIVVTAQKRAQNLTDVPISVTAVQGGALANNGVKSVMALGQVVPGLRVDQNGAYSAPTIRGVGSSIAGTGFSNNVAVYVDGFYNPSQSTTDSMFVNLESVEVLKGPQGTLFGRNATGGAILMASSRAVLHPDCGRAHHLWTL